MVTIQTLQESDLVLLVINGEIDASSSIELDNAILSALKSPVARVLVDMTSLVYISSAGLGVFISHLEDFKSQNKSLVLYSLQEKVLEVFRILGLEQIIRIVNTKEEALSE